MRVLAVLVALTACGDDVAGIDLDDYGDARRTAECERLVRCGLFSTQDACERLLLPALDDDARAAIDAKKIAYSPAAAKECLSAISAQSCDATSTDVRTPLPACSDVATGLVKDGLACAFDSECISGSCSEPSCGINECCAGACLPTIRAAAVDGACHRDLDCADGFCGSDTRCHPRVAAREMCMRDEECDFDLACVGATDLEPGRCRDLPLIGEPCPYLRCAEIGATCVDGACAPHGLAGTACTTAADCSPFSECAPSGTCAELAQLGEPCTTACARDAWCDAAEGRCVALMPNGSPCEADDQCESLYCEEGPVFDACTERVICY
jgi:hypothetical protein